MCDKGKTCPGCGKGKLSWIEDVKKGGYDYPVYGCPKCGYKCRDERSKR